MAVFGGEKSACVHESVSLLSRQMERTLDSTLRQRR